MIKSTSKYATKKLPETLEDHKSNNLGASPEQIAIDTNLMRRDHNKLRKLSVELRKIQLELQEADKTMKEKERAVLKEMTIKQLQDWNKKQAKD